MTPLQTEPNPFALMMGPEAIFAAVAASDRLARLKSRICRPLDKPMIAKTDGEAAEFDNAVDGDADDAEGSATGLAGD
jgi:hypothetical protein